MVTSPNRQLFFQFIAGTENHCGDKQDLRGVLPPLCNVPDATELVRQ